MRNTLFLNILAVIESWNNVIKNVELGDDLPLKVNRLVRHLEEILEGMQLIYRKVKSRSTTLKSV